MGKTLKVIAIAVAVVVTAVFFGAPAPFYSAAQGSGIFGLTSAYAAAAAGTALVTGLSLAASKFLVKQPASLQDAIDRLNLTVDPQAPAKWIIGTTPAATDIVYIENHGTNKEWFSLVVAAAAHRVDSFGAFSVDDETLSFSGAAATGNWNDTLWIDYKYGTDSQTALGVLNSITWSWPNDATGYGIAHYHLLLQMGKGKTQGGIPSRVTQVVNGCPVYDPRLDSTNGGTGTHRYDDNTTWEFTNGGVDIGRNWALAVVVYLLGWYENGKLVWGMGVDPDDINWDQVVASANVCEETVDSAERFFIDGIMALDGNHDRVLNELESAIGGHIAFIGGQWFVWAPNDDLTEYYSISDTDLIPDVGVEFNPTIELPDLYNTARGRFVDPSSLYQPVVYPDVEESTAITDDDGYRILPMDFSLIQSEARAQRVARYLVRRSRFGGSWTFAMGPKGLLFRPFTVTSINLTETDGDDVTVRVVDMTFSLTGVVALTVVEEDSSIYDTTATLGTSVSQQDPNVIAAGTKVAVTGIAASSTYVQGTNGTKSDAIAVSWDDPGGFVSSTEIQYKKTTDTNYTPLGSGHIGFLNAVIVPVEPNTGYTVRVRHVTVKGTVGDWVTGTLTTSTQSTSAGIVGQGALATANTATWSTQVTGTGKPDDNADVTSAHTAAAITGQGDLATMDESELTINQIFGAVDLLDRNLNVGSGTTTQGYRVDSDGNIYATTVSSGVYTSQGAWLNSGTNSDFQVKASKISGLNLTSGTLDQWLTCSTDRTWYRTASTGSITLQLTIRSISTGIILDTCQVVLDNVTA